MGALTFMYRLRSDGIEARVFDSDLIPEAQGWHDSPGAAESAGVFSPDKPQEPKAEPAKAKRPRRVGK